MHLTKDENGNEIAHSHGCAHSHDSSHEHCHSHGDAGHCSNHGSSHNEASEPSSAQETLALLTYMLQHNEHHAAELDVMSDKLKELEVLDAAKLIKEAVEDFQKGNMRLSLALTLVKESLKEV
ncbi:MAG: cobalt transporter [Lachnospiraceae bacterium]